jgi:thiol-disulfide isomerase/thioredoxin
MQRILSALWIFGLVVLLAACGGDDTTQSEDSSTASSSSATGPLPGKVRDVGPEPVPDLTLETLDGTSIDLAAQEGKLLLINFWATWCAPCREEIPDLKALHTDLDNLTVIGIALDRKGREVVEPFARKLEINYPIVIDEAGTAEAAFGPIPGLPTTILVSPEGQITKRVVGIFPTEDMKPTLQEMLSPDA